MYDEVIKIDAKKILDSLVARKIKASGNQSRLLKLSKDTLTKKSGVAIKKGRVLRKNNRDTLRIQ
jgi:hypothetical protein